MLRPFIVGANRRSLLRPGLSPDTCLQPKVSFIFDVARSKIVLDRLKTAQQGRSGTLASRALPASKRAPIQKVRVPPLALHSMTWKLERSSFIQS